jgi:hypothetical protein
MLGAHRRGQREDAMTVSRRALGLGATTMSVSPALSLATLSPAQSRASPSSLPSPPPSPNAVEAGRDLPSPAESELDPLLLRSKLQPTEHINSLRNRGDRRTKKVSSFYRVQNQHILKLLKPIEHHEAEADDKESQERLQVPRCLLAGQILLLNPF